MAKQLSPRCGYSNCPFYDKDNHESKCSKFTNRNDCELSLSHYNKAAKASKEKAKLREEGYIL